MKVIVALGMISVLSACVADETPAPTYRAPLSGISNQQVDEVPLAATVPPASSVALILSDNVDKSIVYNNLDRKYAASFALPNTAAIADQDPRYLNDRTVALLREFFPNLVLVNNLSEAAAKGLQQSVVLDMRVRVGQQTGDKSQVSLLLVFFNKAGRGISRVEGSGSATVPYPAFTSRFRVAADEALAQLRTNLSNAIAR